MRDLRYNLEHVEGDEMCKTTETTRTDKKRWENTNKMLQKWFLFKAYKKNRSTYGYTSLNRPLKLWIAPAAAILWHPQAAPRYRDDQPCHCTPSQDHPSRCN